MANYKYKCKKCGHEWETDSPELHCDNCFVERFQFTCKKCGHEWNEITSHDKKCPNCKDSGDISYIMNFDEVKNF